MKIATIQELQNIPCRDNGEPLVPLENGIFVRKSVAEKIARAKKSSKRYSRGWVYNKPEAKYATIVIGILA